ncbi:MAG: DDE-type integrase/transposase/recombinase, partial [Candidatus Thiodiazotropha taylori]|nr:DDE-type integrase/transposase/recombinase [Candidatus Thiodiazotropha taylori]MCW4336263.1 DDE-type integrase/transposase/recombinase [Candidatus Thiodiazotropha endolucinida]
KRVQMWALTIQGYNAEIKYIKGSSNCLADLLSRVPRGEANEVPQDLPVTEDGNIPDVSDRSYEIGVINSNEADLSKFASCKLQERDELKKPDTLGFDMVVEQSKDPEIYTIKTQLEADSTAHKKYIVLDNVLYYISNVDEDPKVRLYVPSHLTDKVIEDTHKVIHLGFDKTFDAIRSKYFWPNLYKHVYEYVSKCVDCQSRNMQKVKSPLKEVDTPPFPFAKIAIDMVGPLPKTLSGNQYIFTAIDWYSGYLEAWPLPDKKADGIAHLLLDELFPRFSFPLEVVSDNGKEICNATLNNLFKKLNIRHRKTNVYSPNENRVERSHRTLLDVLSKKVKDNPYSWDLYLNQALAAIRFSENVSTKQSPFFYLFQRDPVLPIDNLLKPRRKYYGDDIIEKGLEQAHKAFVLMHRRRKQAHRRQAKYADKTRKITDFKVGQPVYLKKHKRNSKLDKKWSPYYRIIKQLGEKTWELRDQLTGEVFKSSSDNMRLANIDEWEIPKSQKQRKFRRAYYAMTPEGTDNESMTSDTDSESEGPTTRLAKKYRKVRSDSEEEDHIPLAELASRLKARKARLKQEQANLHSRGTTKMDSSKGVKTKHMISGSEPASEHASSSENDESSLSGPEQSSEEGSVVSMEVNNVLRNKQKKFRRVKTEKSKVKTLLESLVDVL